MALEKLPSPWLDGAIPLREQKLIEVGDPTRLPVPLLLLSAPGAGSPAPTTRAGRDPDHARGRSLCDSGVDDIAVLDPIFNVGQLAVPVLERFGESGFRGRLSLQCRAELVDAAFLAAAVSLRIRLEFGLQTVHEHESTAIERKNEITKVDAALADVRRLGLAHEVSANLGLPNQTLASFVESVAWCLERRVPVIKAFPLMLSAAPSSSGAARAGGSSSPGPDAGRRRLNLLQPGRLAQDGRDIRGAPRDRGGSPVPLEAPGVVSHPGALLRAVEPRPRPICSRSRVYGVTILSGAKPRPRRPGW